MTFAGLKQKFEQQAGKNRLLQMEGLRGVAILLVFLYHYYWLVWAGFSGMTPTIDALGVIGGSGVDLFFVLSGYLIYGAVTNPTFRFGTFLRRRVNRLYPAFLVVLALYVLISLMLGARPGSPQSSWDRIPADPGLAGLYITENLLFLPGVFPIRPIMNVAWSLSYEWFFYLFLPPAYWAFRFQSLSPKNRAIVLGGTAAAIAGAHLVAPALFLSSGNPSRSSHIRSIMFLGGMIVRELVCLRRPQEYRLDRLAWLFLPLIAAIVLILQWAPPPDRPAEIVRRETLFSATLFVLYPLLVFMAIQGKPAVARVLSLSPLRWLGNMSYSFYLFHGLTLHGLGLVLASLQKDTHSLGFLLTESIVFLPAVFLLTVAACIPLFLLVERPFSLSPTKLHGRTATVFLNLRTAATPAEAEAAGSR